MSNSTITDSGRHGSEPSNVVVRPKILAWNPWNRLREIFLKRGNKRDLNCNPEVTHWDHAVWRSGSMLQESGCKKTHSRLQKTGALISCIRHANAPLPSANQITTHIIRPNYWTEWSRTTTLKARYPFLQRYWYKTTPTTAMVSKPIIKLIVFNFFRFASS